MKRQEFILKTTFDESDLSAGRRLIVEIFDMDRSKIGENELKQGNSRSFYYSTSSKKKSYKFYTKIDRNYSAIHKRHRSAR